MSAPDLPFSIHARSVFVSAADALVLADLHLGKGATSDVDAPIQTSRDTFARLEKRLEAHDPSTVVIAGDLLDAFDRVPRGVEAALSELRELVSDADASIVVTVGNHDRMLEEVYDGALMDEFELDDGETVVCHGHEEPETEGTRYVIGHDHPALSVQNRKRPCFLYGPGVYEGRDVLVCPAFTRLASGRTVNELRGADVQSPLISSTDSLYPAVRDETNEETLWFPPLGESRHFL